LSSLLAGYHAIISVLNGLFARRFLPGRVVEGRDEYDGDDKAPRLHAVFQTEEGDDNGDVPACGEGKFSLCIDQRRFGRFSSRNLCLKLLKTLFSAFQRRIAEQPTVYTCDFVYELGYDSKNDLLPKQAQKVFV
jgi:hypothetical protein